MTQRGVGSILESWIPEWSKIEKRTACDCKKLRDEMDALGPDEVEKQLERFIEHFVGQKRYLRKTLQVTPEVIMRGWVRMMIQRACSAARQDVQPKLGKDTRKRRS